MKRHNPPANVAMTFIAPLLPYVVVGGILYFYGGKIWEVLAARLSGKSVAQIKADVATTKEALKTASKTDIAKAALGTTISIGSFGLFSGDFSRSKVAITPAQQKAQLAEIARTRGFVAGVKVPYPTPASQAEFRANIDAINKAKAWKI